MTDQNRYHSLFTRLLLLISLLVIIFFAVGCNLKPETSQGIEQSEKPPTPAEPAKENVEETTKEASTDSTKESSTAKEFTSIKIQKDKGDAVDAFYTAFEAGQPIFLYFYTDT